MWPSFPWHADVNCHDAEHAEKARKTLPLSPILHDGSTIVIEGQGDGYRYTTHSTLMASSSLDPADANAQSMTNHFLHAA